jgi:hypothetical protein
MRRISISPIRRSDADLTLGLPVARWRAAFHCHPDCPTISRNFMPKRIARRRKHDSFRASCNVSG